MTSGRGPPAGRGLYSARFDGPARRLQAPSAGRRLRDLGSRGAGGPHLSELRAAARPRARDARGLDRVLRALRPRVLGRDGTAGGLARAPLWSKRVGAVARRASAVLR